MKIPLMLTLSALLLVAAHAEEPRIQPTDALGNIQYDKPSFTVRNDGRVIETDPLGNKLYDHQQYQIKGNKMYSTDSVGNIQYNKPIQKLK